MVKADRGHIHIEGKSSTVSNEISLLMVSYAQLTGKTINDTVLDISNVALRMYDEVDKNDKQ